MESNYLPDILDHTLRGYVAFYGLTSWKIYGGLYNKATVILRFGSSNLDEQGEQPHQQTFRKKPPSAVERDRSRIQQFKGTIKPTPCYSNMDDVNVDTIVEFTPGAMMHGGQSAFATPPLPSLPQVDGQCDTGCKQPSTFVYSDDVYSKKHDGVQDSDSKVPETTETGHSTELAIENDVPLDTETNMDKSDGTNSTSSSDEEESSTDECELIRCRYCDGILGQGIDQWYKCTDCCSAEGHFDVCIRCYDLKHHFDHMDSMSLFKNPTQGNQRYCDSCGYEFHSNDRVYECKECKETENGCFLFEMCRICFNKGCHKVHHEHLRRVRDKAP